MNTKHTGDASEATVIAALVRRGYSVSIPFGDNDPYDLIVDTDGELIRVQVKTGWLENGCVRFKTYSKTTGDGAVVDRDYTEGEVDTFAVRCRDTGDLYWIPIADTGSKNTYLRVEEPEIDHPNVNRAEDFAFEKKAP